MSRCRRRGLSGGGGGTRLRDLYWCWRRRRGRGRDEGRGRRLGPLDGSRRCRRPDGCRGGRGAARCLLHLADLTDDGAVIGGGRRRRRRRSAVPLLRRGDGGRRHRYGGRPLGRLPDRVTLQHTNTREQTARNPLVAGETRMLAQFTSAELKEDPARRADSETQV